MSLSKVVIQYNTRGWVLKDYQLIIYEMIFFFVYLTIQLTFYHMLFKMKRVELHFNSRFERPSEIIKQIRKEICVSKIFTYSTIIFSFTNVTLIICLYLFYQNNKEIYGLLVGLCILAVYYFIVTIYVWGFFFNMARNLMKFLTDSTR